MRYRKIDVRLWVDAKFQRLSPSQPCGQTLFLYLLTTPSSNMVPGLWRCGRLQLSEELKWAPDAFDKAFAELEALGMVVGDWDARLVWMPNAIRHNSPANPNVIKGWAHHLGELPECTLRTRAVAAIYTHLRAKDPLLRKTFERICPEVLLQAIYPVIDDDDSPEHYPEPLPEPLRQPLDEPTSKADPRGINRGSRIQDQDQEQKQEQITRERARKVRATARSRAAITQPPPARRLELVEAGGLIEVGGGRDHGHEAVREFQNRLPTLSMHDYGSWQDDWRWIGLQPAAERAAVVATLAADAWAQANWRRCTPRHVRRHWQAYAAGESPVQRPPPANDNHGRAWGPSEVSTPAEFDDKWRP